MSLNEHRVREYAYYLWESEGKPHGQSVRHWEMACKLAEAEAQADTSTATPGALSGQPASSAEQTASSTGTPKDKDSKTKKTKAKKGNGSDKIATQTGSYASGESLLGSVNPTSNASAEAAQTDGGTEPADGKTKAKSKTKAKTTTREKTETQDSPLASAEETFGQAHATFTTDSLVTAKSDGEFPDALKKPKTRKPRKPSA